MLFRSIHGSTVIRDSNRADRWELVAIMLVAGPLGWALSTGTLTSESPRVAAESPAPSRSSPAPAPSSSATPRPVSEPPPRRPTPRDEQTQPLATQVEPPPAPQSPVRPPAAVELRIDRGRVAYLRCDGIELRGDVAFPCPRDRNLERRAWAAVDALPTCGGQSPAASGTADLRLSFKPGQEPNIWLHQSTTVVHEDAWEQCLRTALEEVGTQLNASPLVVSFRFEIGPR